MSAPRIAVVGSSNIDLVARVPRFAREGETLRARGFSVMPGGKGANQAAAAARLGADVTFVTRLGRDRFGQEQLESFRALGMRTDQVLFTSEAPSGVAAIQVADDGRNSIVIAAGANDLLTPSDIDAARHSVAECAVLVVQLEIPLQSAAAALRIGREQGVRTILNPAPAPPRGADELLALADVVCPNEGEAGALTGVAVADPEAATRAGRRLIELGASNAIVTRGESGSVLVDSTGRATPIETPEVAAVDTTGAGDAFVGGLAFFLAAGTDLPEAARRASHVAAASVLAPGARGGLPSPEDLPPEFFDDLVPEPPRPGTGGHR